MIEIKDMMVKTLLRFIWDKLRCIESLLFSYKDGRLLKRAFHGGLARIWLLAYYRAERQRNLGGEVGDQRAIRKIVDSHNVPRVVRYNHKTSASPKSVSLLRPGERQRSDDGRPRTRDEQLISPVRPLTFKVLIAQ